MISKLKKRVSKKNGVKKEQASNGSASHRANAIGTDVSSKPEHEQRHDDPGYVKQELKPDNKADDSKYMSAQCRQKGASNQGWENIYPSLPKGPDTRGTVEPQSATVAVDQVILEGEQPGPSGIAGAAAVSQSGQLDGQFFNAQLPGVKPNNEPALRGLQETADLLNQMSINQTQEQQEENLTTQTQSNSISGFSQRHDNVQNQVRPIAPIEPSGQSRQVIEEVGAVGGEEPEENEGQIHAQEEAEQSVEPLVSDLQKNTSLMDKISLMLYPYNPVIKNWESLAYELHAPPNIRAQCKRITHHSQTRVLFETLSTSAETEDLRVNRLIAVLNALKRKDVVEFLKKKISEARLQNKVSEEITSDEELMEELETFLDKESRVVKNWYYVGLKLGLSKETLQGIKDGNSPHNGVPALFEFIYTKRPDLTVEQFKTIMNDIDRKDIVDKLSDVGPGPMKVRISHDSDEMRSLCYLLNKNSCGTVKDWRHLALKLDIDYEQYKSFDKETPESPTKVLIDWALADTPNMTVEDLCNLFKNMKRYDVIETIEQYYGRSFIES